MLALTRPCSCYVCDVHKSVTMFLLKTFALNVDTMLRLKYLEYDRACDLSINQSAGNKSLLNSWLIDILQHNTLCACHQIILCASFIQN